MRLARVTLAAAAMELCHLRDIGLPVAILVLAWAKFWVARSRCRALASKR